MGSVREHGVVEAFWKEERYTLEWLVRKRQPFNGSDAMVLASKRFRRRSRLQTEAMVICPKGLNPARSSKSRLNVKHPSFNNLTSDLQYAP